MRAQMTKDFNRDADFFEAGTRKMRAHMSNEATQKKYGWFVKKLNKKHKKEEALQRKKKEEKHLEDVALQREKTERESENSITREPEANASPLSVVKKDE